MKPELRGRWELEILNRKEPLNKPQDLLRRAPSSEDFVDAAVIGGVGVADILAEDCRVADSIGCARCFPCATPAAWFSFVDAVKHLSGHRDELAIDLRNQRDYLKSTTLTGSITVTLMAGQRWRTRRTILRILLSMMGKGTSPTFCNSKPPSLAYVRKQSQLIQIST